MRETMKPWKYALFGVGLLPACILCLWTLSAIGVFGGYMVQYVGSVDHDSFEWQFNFGRLTIADRDWLFWVVLAGLLIGAGWLWLKTCAVLSRLRLSQKKKEEIPNPNLNPISKGRGRPSKKG